MDQAAQIINRVLPILLLIILGYWIRRTHFLSQGTIDDIKKLVINFALPSVLFISFLNIQLELKYLVLFIILFMLCMLLYWLGKFLKRQFNIQHTYFPFMTTGFEYGMLGISLFGAAYGLENIGYIAIVDLGHEIFIWSVFLALLLMQRDGIQDSKLLIKSFLKSPVSIAILLGILLNIMGVKGLLYQLPVTGALMETLKYLGGLTIPLILIIVGYGIKFDRLGFKDASLVVALRLSILIPLALILIVYLFRGPLQLGKPFEAALFTLLILPPPFIVPLYIKPENIKDKHYVNNVLTVYTVVTIIIFTIFFILNPSI